jgi:hypothetical protein
MREGFKGIAFRTIAFSGVFFVDVAVEVITQWILCVPFLNGAAAQFV